MEEEQMPTAFDLICGKEELFCEGPTYSESGYTSSQVQQFMIKFAMLHLEAAVKAIAANVSVAGCNCNHPNYCTGECKHIDAKSILNAYPPENIK